jgi:hypothetical protein
MCPVLAWKSRGGDAERSFRFALAVALAAQSEPCDDGAIASVVLLDQVRKKAATLSDELEEAAAGLVILREGSQVLR